MRNADNLRIYNCNNINKRLLAVDGTNIFLQESSKTNGSKISRNNNYCTALISAIFNIDLEMPINYTLSLKNCERKTLVFWNNLLSPPIVNNFFISSLVVINIILFVEQIMLNYYNNNTK